MASEMTRVADQLQRAFERRAWHGPALMEALKNVDAKLANARPIAGAHTIWELALHVAAWEEVILRRLQGEALTLSAAKNFPKIRDASEAAWKQALALVRRRHEELVKRIRAFPEKRLGEQVPGKKYDIYTMLHGATQHVIYHAGQIVLLKKAVE